MVVVGCSKAETLASLNRQRPALLVQLRSCSVERVGSVRLGRAYRHSTLLGPERTTESRHCAVRLLFRSRHDLASHTAWVSGFGVGR
jgi:hypothetical protein